MSMNENWMKLQFFAEGAPGGDGGGEGSAAGVEAPAVAGQERTLESLGVPKAKAEKHRAITGAKRAGAQLKPEQSAAAETTSTAAELQERGAAAEAANQPEQKKLSWEEILKDEDYSREMQSTVSRIIKADREKRGNAQAQLEELKPMLEMLAPRYGQNDPGKIDYKALAESVTQDKRFYENKAAELGTSTEVAMEYERLKRESEKRKAEEQDMLLRQQQENRKRQLIQQAGELKKEFPDFNLDKELENPVFQRMVHMNLSLEQAYHAVHHKEIREADERATTQRVSAAYANSVRSGQMPAENGKGRQAAGTAAPKQYKEWTKAERESFKAHIRKERAHGRKVPLQYTLLP